MRPIILYVAASIDGYIARPDGAVDWLEEMPNPDNSDFGYYDFYARVDTLIMGRKTYESIGKPLPGRTTIVVTRNPNYQAEGCFVAHSIGEALDLAEKQGEDEAFICGGTEIYRESLRETDYLYLTRVHAQFQVDTSFPEFDLLNWEEISAEFHPADKENQHPFTFFIYERRSRDA